jgi:PAS domain S-box-containing protein
MRELGALLSLFVSVLMAAAAGHAENGQQLKVGVSLYSPPVFFEEDNFFAVQGISVDLAQLIADQMNTAVQFYAIDDLDPTEVLKNGVVDFAIGMADDFKDTGFLRRIETDIRSDRNYFINIDCTDFNSLEDLPGHTVILRGGNFVSRVLTSRRDIVFLEPKTESEGLALLDAGEAQVYISHSNLLDIETIRKRGFHNIRKAEGSITDAPIVIVFNNKDHALYETVKKAYEKAVKTTRYHRILNLWINRDIQFFDPGRKNVGLFFATYARYIQGAIMLILFALLSILLWSAVLKKKVLKVTKNLRISEQKYKDLIDSSPDMIHMVAPNGDIKLSNRSAMDFHGFSKEEIAAMKLKDLVAPEQESDVAAFLQCVFADGCSKREFIFKAKNASRIHVEMVAIIVNWDYDGARYVCCFSRDLTERKRLEEKLIQSDRLAVMGQMAAGLAHEINNPLGIILTNSEELRNHTLDAEESDECLKAIERNAIRAGKIIEDLLSFTRPSPMDSSQVSLVQLIEECLFFLKHKIKQKKITVEQHYGTSPAVVSGDEKLIQQLLINLIINAIQAVNPSGHINVTVRTTNSAAEGEQAVVEIKDDGIGIHEADADKIFDPFFTSRKKGGFGLGLFISRIIVEKHGGSIVATSGGKEQGTTLTVRFPLSRKGVTV